MSKEVYTAPSKINYNARFTTATPGCSPKGQLQEQNLLFLQYITNHWCIDLSAISSDKLNLQLQGVIAYGAAQTMNHHSASRQPLITFYKLKKLSQNETSIISSIQCTDYRQILQIDTRKSPNLVSEVASADAVRSKHPKPSLHQIFSWCKSP